MAHNPAGGLEAPGFELLTDLYELAMVEAYLSEELVGPAVFSLFARTLPKERNYLLAAGIADVLTLIEQLHFTEEDLRYLASLHRFSDRTLRWLRAFRFEGDVWAMPEGTAAFENEPLVEVVAPLPQAQLIETLVLNQVHLQTLAASKAARVVEAAQGRTLVEFGLRRIHGFDAGLKVARSSFLAGFDATSNVLAGARYGIPISGTMAHSYVQAHPAELDAFRAFTRVYPEATLLVDTYDTLEGVRNVIRLAREQGERFRARSIRLDSGDLIALAKASRRMLDEAGLEQVGIFASGGLDEHRVARCIAEGAPIDGFGVGTSLGVSSDAPSLDMAYKLVAYAGQPRMKLSTGKVTYPLQKQVFRSESAGLTRDVLALHGERLPGRPLLALQMRGGKRVFEEPLTTARDRALRERTGLSAALRSLSPAGERHEVQISPALASERARLADRLRLR